MAEIETPTAEEAARTPGTGPVDDPVGLIEDNIVRRLVRFAIHVRGYAPYYGATIAFGAMLLLVPALGGSPESGNFAAGVTNDPAPRATAAPSTTAPRASAPSALASSADDFFTPAVTTEAVRSGSTYSFDDSDYESSDDTGSDAPAATDEKDKPCYVPPPDDVPVSPVSPERETKNAQDTLESAVGQEAPAEGGETVGTVVEATGQCEEAGSSAPLSTPETPTAPASAPDVDTDAVVDLIGNAFVF